MIPAILSRLHGVQQVGSGWSALCPAHDDQRSSLSVAIGDRGKTLVTCHAGCSTQQIVTAAGMRIADLYPPVVATYTYCDENGTLLYEVIRDEAKNFRQRYPTVTAGGSGRRASGRSSIAYPSFKGTAGCSTETVARGRFSQGLGHRLQSCRHP